MKPDVFSDLRDHYTSVAKELSSKARQAGLLNNPTGVGTEREEVYRAFLDRHVPKMCDVFLGGYIFDVEGNKSAQIDVIVTSGNAPRFRMSSGNRFIAPLEGTIAVAEIKSHLSKDTLHDALNNCASIPCMPASEGIVAPYLKLSEDNWQDSPYKIVFAYDGIDASTICGHIAAFYTRHQEIPFSRRPNIIHVLGEYMIMRIIPGMTVNSLDGTLDTNQPQMGEYYPFFTGSDASAMAWILINLQEKAFISNSLLYRYREWHNKIVVRMWSGSP